MTKYPNEYMALQMLLLKASSALRVHIVAIAEGENLTMQQLNALRILRGANETQLAVQDIHQRLMEPGSDTSRLISRLQAKDLVHIKPCTKDKRRVQITLSAAGRAVLSRIDEKLQGLVPHMQSLPPEEVQAMNTCLEKLTALLTTQHAT
jgi:DNA-binding MarR family transcriptional regulator